MSSICTWPRFETEASGKSEKAYFSTPFGVCSPVLDDILCSGSFPRLRVVPIFPQG